MKNRQIQDHRRNNDNVKSLRRLRDIKNLKEITGISAGASGLNQWIQSGLQTIKTLGRRTVLHSHLVCLVRDEQNNYSVILEKKSRILYGI